MFVFNVIFVCENMNDNKVIGFPQAFHFYFAKIFCMHKNLSKYYQKYYLIKHHLYKHYSLQHSYQIHAHHHHILFDYQMN